MRRQFPQRLSIAAAKRQQPPREAQHSRESVAAQKRVPHVHLQAPRVVHKAAIGKQTAAGGGSAVGDGGAFGRGLLRAVLAVVWKRGAERELGRVK